MFSELHLKKKPLQVTRIYNDSGPHIIVLVHGYKGSAYDMRSWRTNIAMMYPNSVVLSSTINEGDLTDGDIELMGKRLSEEVRMFVRDWTAKTGLGRLTFIAHSMGGIIVRAALPYLKQYASQMFNYISLGSPHLGYMYNKSRIIDTGKSIQLWNIGLWIMKKFKKC